MRIFIISDLHITDGHALCTFGWQQKDFIDCMESVKKRYAIDTVFLNGDTFDVYKCKFKNIAARNRELIEYLNRTGAIFIRGNHDRGFRHGHDHWTIINSRGERIHIEHGHRADLFNGTPIGRGMGRAFFRLLKPVFRFARPCEWYFGMVGRLEAAKRTRTGRQLRYAARLLRNNNVVILGHSHRMEVHDLQFKGSRRKYCNTGSCSFGRLQGVILDTETLEHILIRESSGESLNRRAEESKRQA